MHNRVPHTSPYNEAMAAEILVGTSGYSFPDWVGPVYPQGLPRSRWLPFYAEAFSTVEINATYYRVPTEAMLRGLLAKVDPMDFVFTVKTPSELTHSRAAFDQAAEPFVEALTPLRQSGALGTVLAQFPYSFRRPEVDRGHLKRLRDAIPADIPVHVEFRHEIWYTPEILAFVKQQGLGVVNVDLPPLRGLPREVTDFVTNGIGYFRFHGRNTANWWRSGAGGARYDYLYTEDELETWVPAILRAAGRSERTFLFLNNCHRGKSAVNAVQLERRLGLRAPEDRAPWERLERRLLG